MMTRRASHPHPTTPTHSREYGRRDAAREHERGTTSLEAVIVVPVILLLVFAVIEGGLHIHVRNQAARAASTAAVSAAAWHASDADGVTAGRQVLSQTVDAENASITITRTDTQVIATVTAASPTLTGTLLNRTLSQSAAAPIERWTP